MSLDNNSLHSRRIKIAIFSQPEYFRFMYENDLDSFADVFEFKLQVGLSKSDFIPLIEYKADYNFFFRGEYLPDGVLEKLSGVKVALSSEPFPRVVEGKYEYTIDSIKRYFVFRNIRKKPFDYVFHYDDASLDFLKWDQIFISGQFAFPVATSVYKKKINTITWDLFFIGRSTPHREAHFGHLKHIYNFLHICHGVWGEPLLDYICASKICLNIHAENEISWEPRMQMMLACGAFVISEKITPNNYLRPGVDYVEIASADDLYRVVSYYLSHDDERLKIAKSGHDRIREILDSKTNFQNLILDIDGNKYKKYSAGSGSVIFDFFMKGWRAWAWIKYRLGRMR